MNLLMFTSQYPPSGGGYEIACKNMSDGLAARGHCVTVLTSPSADGPICNTAVKIAATLQLHPPRPVWKRFMWWWARELNNRLIIFNFARNQDFDAIVVWKTYPLPESLLWWLHRSRKPVIYYLHDEKLALGRLAHWDEFWGRKAQRKDLGLIKRILRISGLKRVVEWLLSRWFQQRAAVLTSEQCVFVSQSCLEEYIEAGLPVRGAPVIYNGIETDLFFTEARSYRPEMLKFLFIGRIDRNKGIHVLIEALGRLPARHLRRCSLSIVGPVASTAYRDELLSLTKSCELASVVQFHDAIANSQAPAWYCSHDVFVFPSTGTERFPLTILEAMASGLPVVSTLTGGHREILQDDANCLTCRTDDVGHLTKQLCRLFDEPTLLGRLGEAGKQLVVNNFSLDATHQQFEDYLAGQIDGHALSIDRSQP